MCLPVCSLHKNPLLERVYFKKKEFAPFGSEFFLFKVDPFEKEGKTNLRDLCSVLLPRKFVNLCNYRNIASGS